MNEPASKHFGIKLLKHILVVHILKDDKLPIEAGQKPYLDMQVFVCRTTWLSVSSNLSYSKLRLLLDRIKSAYLARSSGDFVDFSLMELSFTIFLIA